MAWDGHRVKGAVALMYAVQDVVFQGGNYCSSILDVKA